MAEIGHKPDTSGTSGQDTDAHGVMVARARALIPQLRERAARTEELRRLPPETERDLHETGLFRVLQPKRVGGSELDYVALVDCADALGQADASVAWNFANLASHHWMLAMFDPRAQHAVWNADADALIASSFIFPAGRARKVDGGYVLSGNWPFSSGVESCEWNMLASVVASDDEADGVEYRIFLVNKQDYRIKDIWNATGLRGTGSNEVEVENAFVAEAMSVAVSDLTGGPTPGSTLNPNALYALPVFSLFPYVLSGVGLGNAQACLDDYVEIARHRASTYNRAKLGDMQSTQIKIAEASAKIDAARLIMRSNMHCGHGGRKTRSCSRHRRKDETEAGWSVFRQSLHRGGIAFVCSKWRTELVHVRYAAAPVPRRSRDQFSPCLQFRCRRDQLWTRSTGLAV